MRTSVKYKSLIKPIVIVENILLLNILYFAIFYYFFEIDFDDTTHLLQLAFINISYLLSLIIYQEPIKFRTWQLRVMAKSAFYHLGMTMFFTFVIMFLIPSIKPETRELVLFYFPLLFVSFIVFHVITREIMYKIFKSDPNRENAIILGAGVLGKKLYQEFTEKPYLSINPLGLFDDNPAANDGNLLGSIADVEKYTLENKVTQIYCTLPETAREKIKEIIGFAERNVINFLLVPNTWYYIQTPVVLDMIGNTPILSIRKIPLSQPRNYYLKRLLDLSISTVFLLTAFPFIFIILFIAIKITSPGPVFFVQNRTGKKGETFKCYKFRSMRVNKDSDTKQATSDDNRKTKLGSFMRKTNLDELPQFINVFRGEMSIVGPRPHMLYHTTQYADIVNKYMVRHFIKPGITGLAQVSGFRGETKHLSQMEGRIQNDLHYIEHWTLTMDIKIIIRTFFMFLKRDKNAY